MHAYYRSTLLSFLFLAAIWVATGRVQAQSSKVTVFIRLTHPTVIPWDNPIGFNWDNGTSDFVDDEWLREIEDRYCLHEPQLLALLSDTTVTVATACGKSGPLRQGDFAFLLLDRHYDIPYAAVFQTQYCVVEPGCPFSVQVVAGMENRREEMAGQLREYLVKERCRE